jgi:hypothetical protein
VSAARRALAAVATTALVVTGLAARVAHAQGAASPAPSPRARELGIAAMLGGTPGPLDAITDVAGVEVGHITLGQRERTARRRTRAGAHRASPSVHPRGKASADPCSGAGSRSTATAR